MASLILVLREGAIKQALVSSPTTTRIDQADAQSRRRRSLNERLADLTADRAETGARVGCATTTASRRLAAAHRRAGRRRSCASTTPTAIEEVFSDGLLNVMDAPEFAQSEKLRRVFSALENRAYLGELVGGVADAGRIQSSSATRTAPLEMRDVSLVLAPYGRPGRAIGVVGVLGPDADELLRRRSARSASCPA